jgi:hypothetical protein
MDDLVSRLRYYTNDIDAHESHISDAMSEAAYRIEQLEAALREIAEEGSKALVSTWDTPAESVRQDFAHLWARLAICVDDAEEALGEKKDAPPT